MFARMLDYNKQTNGKRNECPLDLTREVPSSCILHFKVEQSIWCQSASRIATLFRKLRKNVLYCLSRERFSKIQTYRQDLHLKWISDYRRPSSISSIIIVCSPCPKFAKVGVRLLRMLERTKHFYVNIYCTK